MINFKKQCPVCTGEIKTYLGMVETPEGEYSPDGYEEREIEACTNCDYEKINWGEFERSMYYGFYRWEM